MPLSPGGSTTNTFVTAACRADDYKSQLGTGTWHYIDLPISPDGTSHANFVPPSFDVVQAINQCIATLQSGSATPARQAVSLRYLIHCVADIQQPLRCTAAFFAAQPNGDAGGNGFTITGTWSNPHPLNTLFVVKLSPFRPANDDFGFSWNSVSGAVYHLKRTEDPARPNWNPLTDVTATGSPTTFQESAVNGRRFYRIRK